MIKSKFVSLLFVAISMVMFSSVALSETAFNYCNTEQDICVDGYLINVDVTCKADVVAPAELCVDIGIGYYDPWDSFLYITDGSIDFDGGCDDFDVFLGWGDASFRSEKHEIEWKSNFEKGKADDQHVKIEFKDLGELCDME
jgi:hypothetical protein